MLALTNSAVSVRRTRCRRRWSRRAPTRRSSRTDAETRPPAARTLLYPTMIIESRARPASRYGLFRILSSLRRQTSHIASQTIRLDIFDVPACRSTNTIGYLDDREALPPAPEVHLDLERVAVRPDRAEFDRLQHLAAEALEAARGVAERQSRDDMRVDVREVAEEEPLERPVDDVGARDVARTQNDIVLLGSADEIRDDVGVVREVGVHLDDEVDVRCLERVRERRAT